KRWSTAALAKTLRALDEAGYQLHPSFFRGEMTSEISTLLEEQLRFTVYSLNEITAAAKVIHGDIKKALLAAGLPPEKMFIDPSKETIDKSLLALSNAGYPITEGLFRGEYTQEIKQLLFIATGVHVPSLGILRWNIKKYYGYQLQAASD